jgi:beta-lactam-binding protein with PASTA domain
MASPTVGILIPNVVGMRLHQARRAMKKAGLKVVIRDEFNERIAPEDRSLFKVRHQSLEAGTRVEPGGWVRLNARPRNFVAMGY